VFYSDLRCGWNRFRVKSRQIHQIVIPIVEEEEEEEEEEEQQQQHEVSN